MLQIESWIQQQSFLITGELFSVVSDMLQMKKLFDLIRYVSGEGGESDFAL